jgi:N-acetylglucosaminyldiphosphoundecaprenol N-acetyl-beta-D-mannosaminyltransferase
VKYERLASHDFLNVTGYERKGFWFRDAAPGQQEKGYTGFKVSELSSNSAARQNFLGVPIDCLTLADTIVAVDRAIRSQQCLRHVCINVAKFVAMRTNKDLEQDVHSSDIISADGMGIVWAARLMGIAIPERVAGIDLMEGVLRLCVARRYRPYFLGAAPDVLKVASLNIQDRFSGLELAGVQHGYFGSDQESDVIAAIKDSRADCLFIGMPTPRKERLLARFHNDFGVPFIMGVGGTFDVLAGRVHRAPRLVQNIGFEWLFRTIQEPLRLGPRYIKTNVAFASIVTRALASRLFQNDVS